MVLARVKFGFFLLVLGVLCAAAVTRARPAEALTLVPPSLEFASLPGRTIETTVKLYNEGSEPVNVYTSTALFTAKDEEGTPDFQFSKEPSDLAAWLKAPESPIGVQPAERVELPVTITVPESAEPGGHYAGLFFETRPPTDTPGQVLVRQKIGTLIIVRVEGEVRESAMIKEFGLGKKSLSRLPADIDVRIENTGNVHVRPSGTVTIRNMMGGVSAVLSLNPKDSAVLPSSIRRFDLQWGKKATNAATGNFFSEIGVELQNFALGTYSAELSATYGSTTKTLSETIRFTVMPWRLLTTALVGIIVLILLLVWIIKSYNAMIIRKAQEHSSSGRAPGAKP